MVYRRSDESIPVTDNWNAAIDAASGEQVIMLGDDDALMPGFLEAVAEAWPTRRARPPLHRRLPVRLSRRVPRAPGGYAQRYGYAEFLQGASGRARVAHETALELVRDAMRFRLRFGFNMQFATLAAG